MRIAVTCPACGKKGTLPEAMRGQRLKCPGCHQPFVVGSSSSEASPRTGLHAAVDYDDDRAYDVRPLRRVSAQSSSQSVMSSSTPATLYVGLGIGAACSVLLAVVAMLILDKPSQQPDRVAEAHAFVAPAGPTQ